jgi:hypothetical protein
MRGETREPSAEIHGLEAELDEPAPEGRRVASLAAYGAGLACASPPGEGWISRVGVSSIFGRTDCEWGAVGTQARLMSEFYDRSITRDNALE